MAFHLKQAIRSIEFDSTWKIRRMVREMDHGFIARQESFSGYQGVLSRLIHKAQNLGNSPVRHLITTMRYGPIVPRKFINRSKES
jgi:hypothetical protein